jgi:hypothetical protein
MFYAIMIAATIAVGIVLDRHAHKILERSKSRYIEMNAQINIGDDGHYEEVIIKNKDGTEFMRWDLSK